MHIHNLTYRIGSYLVDEEEKKHRYAKILVIVAPIFALLELAFTTAHLLLVYWIPYAFHWLKGTESELCEEQLKLQSLALRQLVTLVWSAPLALKNPRALTELIGEHHQIEMTRAVFLRDFDTATRHLNRGIRPDTLLSETPFKFAVWATTNGRPHVVRKLIPIIHLDIDHQYIGENNRTLLIMAIKNGFLRIAQDLLSAGANPDVDSFYGRTALMEAAGAGDKGAVKLLLKSGANPVLEDWYHKTAEQISRMNGHNELANLILKSAREFTPESAKFVIQRDRFGVIPHTMLAT